MFFCSFTEKKIPVCKSMMTEGQATPASRNSAYKLLKIEYILAQLFFGKTQKNIRTTSFLQGSLTIEAALSLPLFLMVSVAMLSFFNILVTEVEMQAALDRTSRRISAGYYAVEEITGNREAKQSLIEKVGSELFYAAVSETLVKDMVLREIDAAAVSDTVIYGGKKGISFLGSRYDENTNEVRIVVNYKMNVPYLPFAKGAVTVMQRSVRRAWIGKTTETAEREQLVYITDTGKVYHTALSCSYIRLSVSAVDPALVGELRNKDGGKYYQCESCGNESAEKAYITGYGDRYHYARDCSGIKRGVKSIPISEIGDRKKCSRCKERDGS